MNLKADSGASHHFTTTQHKNNLKNLTSITNGPSAILPNKTTIKPSHSGYLPLPTSISNKATTSLAYPDMTNESLLSIGQL